MIREEDEQIVKSLTQSEIKVLIKNCDYFSHIVFPYESQKILQQSGTQSLSLEQPKKQAQLQPHILNCSSTNKQKQISEITQLMHLLAAKKDNFNRICVQLFYFMFSCMKKNIVLHFHQHCFVYCASRAKFMVVLKQVTRSSNQKPIDKGYFRLFVQIITQFMLAIEQNILKIEHKVQLLKDDKDSMQSQNIDKVYNQINSNIAYAKNTLQYLRHFIVSAERVDSDIKIQVNCFKQLEKQQFISQNSILRKMTHKSINIYLHKLASKQSQDKLIAAIKSEAKFTKLYNAIKSTTMGTEEKLTQVYQAITSNFEKYIQQGWKQNPAYTKIAQPISSDSKQSTDQKPMLFKVKYKIRNEGRNPEQKPPKQKQRMLQYGVQYHHNTEFPSLVLRLHTQITLQPSTTDEQLQKLNMYAFGSDYFSIEIGTCQKNKKTIKYIILKTISKLIRGSSVLLHFLRYTDMLMAAEQVIQHQDISKANWDGKEGKMQHDEIVKQIVHYSGLVSDLSMNYYDLAVKSG